MQPDPNAAAVAQRIKEVLAEVGVSAAEVARRLATTQGQSYATAQGYVARRMSGSVPFSAVDLINIAKALDVAPTHLLPAGTTLTTSAL